jgi:hypothetical protein
MVASVALVEFDRSDLCKGIRSCSIISVPGRAATKRARGVSSGILVDQDYRCCFASERTPHFGIFTMDFAGAPASLHQCKAARISLVNPQILKSEDGVHSIRSSDPLVSRRNDLLSDP